MIKKILIVSFVLLSFFTIYSIANADCSGTEGGTLCNPLPNGTTPQTLIGKVIQAAMGIVGSIALAMFIYGGFVWMMAAGNAEAVTKGKNILIWATLGLIVIFTSYALVQFVFKGLGVEAT